MMKIKFLILAVGIAMTFGIAGCSSASSADITNLNTDKIQSEQNISGTVSIIGSTTVQPLAESVTVLFNEKYPDISVEIQGVGSGAGIKAVIDGTTDIAMASRELKAEEKSQNIDEHVVAYDGIAVIVNPSNKVENLTTEQIKQIFEGEITNWKDVGGNDSDIIVISREAGSGTKSAFEELVKLTKTDENGKEVSSLKADALVADGNGAIESNIASKENAIGYMSEGYLNESVKALNIDSVECTVENIKNGDYKLSRPLLLLTKGDVSKQAQLYIDLFMSDEGQKIVSEKYIPVN